jgi:hypothetical protein
VTDGFAVVPGLLVDLAGGISDVQAQLDATRDLTDDVGPALGSDVLVAALDHFVSGWRDGRKQISTEVGALAAMLTQAAAGYSDADSALAAAIPDGGS